VLAYQKRGVSRRYTWYGLPDGCETIFFPGCALPGTRPDITIKMFQYLENRISSLGVVLDCCTKTSHDLGQDEFFHAMFGEMKAYLIRNGIKEILTACPNCHRIFTTYGDGLKIRSILEVISQNGIQEQKLPAGTITIHDPCAVRFEKGIQNNVRRIIAGQGIAVEEMKHSRENTLCCGEGAGVSGISPDLAENWGNLRKIEANGKVVVTYCAGCENYLGKKSEILHILDLLFDPRDAIKGRSRVSKAPFTYWNRLRLKNRLKKYLEVNVSRERPFSYGKMGGGVV
jgi:Fe-S oxidoreductase